MIIIIRSEITIWLEIFYKYCWCGPSISTGHIWHRKKVEIYLSVIIWEGGWKKVIRFQQMFITSVRAHHKMWYGQEEEAVADAPDGPPFSDLHTQSFF